LISLAVSKVVLIVLLSETVILQAGLIFVNRNLQRERENKLTTAGALVAAVAHEVGQPLTAITINAAAGKRFLERASLDVGELGNLFDRIINAGSLANEVFENFLVLLAGGKRKHELVDMNVVALEAMHLLRKQLDDHNIVARTMLAPELPDIQGNSGQLREVVLNLAQNSIEAMATSTRQRVISVVTSCNGSDSISISLEDTGPGIDPSKIASIFDPFVTTKANGTGLGLAICKMIVEQHGGTLSAASDMHDGARFEVTLPTHIPAILEKNSRGR
jgi:signal transduction histidine kinase